MNYIASALSLSLVMSSWSAPAAAAVFARVTPRPAAVGFPVALPAIMPAQASLRQSPLAPSLSIANASPMPGAPALRPAAAAPILNMGAAAPSAAPSATATLESLTVPADAPRASEADAAAPAPADVFDGRGRARAWLTRDGAAPVYADLADLGAFLGRDAAFLAQLNKKGRVRLVLPAGADGPAAAAALKSRLDALGVSQRVEVEFIAPPRAKPAAEAAEAAPKGGRLAREFTFLGRQFRASASLPTKSELKGALLFTGSSFALSMLFFAESFLGFQGPFSALPMISVYAPWVFASMAALTLTLKIFHGVFVNTWTDFQSRLWRLRGPYYQAGFNLAYGQGISALYRFISSRAAPDQIASPFSLVYWIDKLVTEFVGTFFGTLGGQAANELYLKGVFTRRGRSTLTQFRSWMHDIDGLFFKLGIRVAFYLLFFIHQFVDLLLYIGSQVPRQRPIIYIALEAAANNDEFWGLYPVKPAVIIPGASRAMQAILTNPLIVTLAPAYRWLKKVLWGRWTKTVVAAGALAAAPGSPEALAADYGRAIASLAALGPSAGDSLPRLKTELDVDGKPVPVTKRGISVPVFAEFPGGQRGVFKPIRIAPEDPMYRFELMKLVRDVAASHIMFALGVPTVRYRAGRADLGGREVLGVVSKHRALTTLKDKPELGEGIVNGEQLVRGAVFDAWLGNVDRIQNKGNIWLIEREDGRHVVFGDYDQGLRPGVEIFGVPKVPLELFQRHATPELVAAARAEVAALTDERVASLVDEALVHAGPMGPPAREFLIGVLKQNRDELKARDPFTGLYGRAPPRVSVGPRQAAALADAVLAAAAPGESHAAAARRLLGELVFVQTHPELLEPAARLLERAVADRVAGRAAALVPDEPGTTLLPVLMNFVYMRVPPEAAIAAGVGYHP